MIETKEALWQFFSQTIESGKIALEAIHSNPAVQAAQPVIGALSIVFGAISGYEIGYTTILKA